METVVDRGALCLPIDPWRQPEARSSGPEYSVGKAAAKGRAVLVLGMPGSGVELLAGIVRALLNQTVDARCAAPLLTMIAEVARLSGWSLADCTMPVIRNFPPDASQKMLEGTVRQQALNVASASVRSHGVDGCQVLDQPVMALSLQFWDAALAQAGLQRHLVLIMRDPLELAQSRHLCGLPLAQVQQRWLRYNLAALRAPWDGERIVVQFDALLSQPGPVIDRLARRLGVSADAGVAARVEPARRTHAVPARVLRDAPCVAPVVKALGQLGRAWNDTTDAARRSALEPIQAAYMEHMLLAGNLVAHAPRDHKLTMHGSQLRASPQRHVLIHYHLFKNAGTSLDAVLQRSFGNCWMEREFATHDQAEHTRALVSLLEQNTHLLALSSHTLLLPPPALRDITIFPILFIRQPLVRLKSAYVFERSQDADTIGTRLAKRMGFGDYLRARLANRHDRACRDFQTYRLAMLIAPELGPERARAQAAIDLLPFVGLVEAFDRSVARLQERVAERFPALQAFSVRANVTTPAETPDRTLESIRDELGGALFDEVSEANRGDVALYTRIRALYA